MENLPSDRRKAIQELKRGREFASQLRRVLQNSHGGDGDKTTPCAEDLVEKVEKSFSSTLLLLNLPSCEGDDVVSPMQPDSSCLVQAKSDDSEDSCKSTFAVKERRGCYKRRRSSQVLEKDSETQIDDGHAWRKYGQKIIMNATYPRSYFRCTHKFDQKCQATKQVQRIQEEPALYRTTYYGNHTCNRNFANPEIILDSISPSGSSILLSFDNSLPTKHDHLFSTSSSSSSLPLAKKQSMEDIPSSSSEDYLLPHELVTLSSTLESNHRYSISDMLCDSIDLDHVFDDF